MGTTVLGVFVGLLLIASAAAHGLLGWPQFKEALDSAQVERSVIAGLAIGWHFGSAAMLGFGSIVLHQALRRVRRQPIQAGPLWAISILYLIFGIAAYVSRHFNPHFLLFIGTGVLVALFGFLGTRHGNNTYAA